MGVFLLELGVVLLTLALLGAIARRVDLSPIPFFLLAGLVLGEGGIHDVAATEDFIGTAGEIGVLLAPHARPGVLGRRVHLDVASTSRSGLVDLFSMHRSGSWRVSSWDTSGRRAWRSRGSPGSPLRGSSLDC